MRRHNTLTRRDARRLEDLVLEHRDEVAAGKWTQTSFAELATRRMGRPVTDSNVQAAAAALDIVFGRTKAVAGKSLKEMRAALVLLAKELVQLKGELGQTVSPTLALLAGAGSEGDKTFTEE